jgi:hypothetical protein
MKYIGDIGFNPKNLKFFFAQNMFFTDKKSQNVKKTINVSPSVTLRRRRREQNFFIRLQPLDHKT